MAVPPLPGPLEHLAPLLTHYGYWAVGAVIFVEDFGIPAPGETILIAAGVYAGAGQLNIVVVALIAFLAAVAGDNVGYLIGHYGGRALVHRWGRYVFLTPERFHKAEDFFTRHGGGIVTVARFIEGLRQFNGIVAGTSGMRWRRFIAFNALGAALWVGLWASLAYVAGNHITAIYDAVARYQLYVLSAVGVLVAGLIIRGVLRRRRRGAEPAGAYEGSGAYRASEGSGATQWPGASEGPGATQWPGASEGSGATQWPGASEGSDATKRPEAPERPGAWESSSATKRPETPERPGASESSSTTKRPGVSERSRTAPEDGSDQ